MAFHSIAIPVCELLACFVGRGYFSQLLLANLQSSSRHYGDLYVI